MIRTQENPHRLPALNASVLVLNRGYLVVHVVGVRRALGLTFRNLAEIIDTEDGSYANHDFESWLTLSDLRSEQKHEHQDWLRSVNFEIQVPRIIRLLAYDRIPRHTLRFNRRNLFARDGHRCQYCGKKGSAEQLSMDHVIPRSRGGGTTWENVVCCCLRCNSSKGGHTPKEARMTLLREPRKPRFNPLRAHRAKHPQYESWMTFLRSAGYRDE